MPRVVAPGSCIRRNKAGRLTYVGQPSRLASLDAAANNGRLPVSSRSSPILCFSSRCRSASNFDLEATRLPSSSVLGDGERLLTVSGLTPICEEVKRDALLLLRSVEAVAEVAESGQDVLESV
jgi:hypothetical protein